MAAKSASRTTTSGSIFAYASDVFATLLCNHYQAAAAAANAHHAAGLDHFIQPTMQHLCTRLWFGALQPGTSAHQAFHSEDDCRRQIATRLFELELYFLFAFGFRLLKFGYSQRRIAMRKTSFCNFAHLCEVSIGVEQV